MDVKTIENACPLCGSDVKGNDEVLFLCRRCQVLFKRKDLAMHQKKKEPEQIAKKEPERKIQGTYSVHDSERDINARFFASAKGKRYHAGNCPYIAFMNRENLISFKSEIEAEKKGLSKCRCLRLKLK